MFKYTVNMDTFSDRIKQSSALDRRITTDQILQLCRILAEQSSKNKSFEFKTDQVDRGKTNEIQSEDITSSRSSEHEYCDRLSEDSEAQQDQHSPVLGDNNGTCPSSAMIKKKHAKKDILNKIRNQIFERKRQKLANLQRGIGGVWRPW